jgi:hypothetical protein
MHWRRTKGLSHPFLSALGKKRHAITRVLFPKSRIQRPAIAQDASRPVPHRGQWASKKCRALLEDKMSIEKDVPSDRGYGRVN